VVVRVPEGADASAQEQNVLTGIQILKDSANQFGFDVKILIAPGLETEAINTKIQQTAKAMGAFAYCALRGATTKADAIAARAAYNEKHQMLLFPEVVHYQGADVHIAALAASMRVLIDSDSSGDGGVGRSLSNYRIVGGIDDIGMPVEYKDEDSLGNQLNKN